MKTRILLAIALTLLTLGAAYGVQRVLFKSPPESAVAVGSAPDPNTKAKANTLGQATALEVLGQVQRKDAQGHWVDIRVGDRLDIDTVVRTSRGASARLAVGENVVVEVPEEAELAVAEVSEGLSRVRLDDGRIASFVKSKEGFQLRVEFQGSDVKAETSGGAFYAMKQGAGPISVASKEGTTRVSSQAGAVAVGAGEQTVVEPGKAPSVPVKIPTSLLLKLGRIPSQLRTRETTIQGSTSPGAIVSLNGERTTANADGQFEQHVALQEGENALTVEVVDAVGRKQKQDLPKIRVDSRPPNVVGKVKW
ncbi:MAG: hypothetical protein SFV15_08355 [Polyangiaceae bacterium]|nr:hypothetical protein [Polyangiaceae bacterium]